MTLISYPLPTATLSRYGDAEARGDGSSDTLANETSGGATGNETGDEMGEMGDELPTVDLDADIVIEVLLQFIYFSPSISTVHLFLLDGGGGAVGGEMGDVLPTVDLDADIVIEVLLLLLYNYQVING